MNVSNKPLYQVILDEYREKITTGELAVNDRLPSESELAELFNVSRITSKRALEELEREGYIVRLKGSGSYVSEDWNKSGISGMSKENRIYSIVLPFGTSYGRSMELIQGASAYLQQQGHHLTVNVANRDLNQERDILTGLLQSNIAGIIYYPGSEILNLDVLYRLQLQGSPVVMVDKHISGVPFSTVVSDNVKGGYLATTHLCELKHKEIAYFSDMPFHQASSVKERFYGYCQAHADYGLELNENNFIIDFLEPLKMENPTLYKMIQNCEVNDAGVEFFKHIWSRLLDRPKPITAIHTLNDYTAIFLLNSAIKLGISVPNEVSIVGFDNIELTSHLEVPLTTVEQDFFSIGHEAAKQLTAPAPKAGEPPIIRLPVNFIERKSTAVCNR